MSYAYIKWQISLVFHAEKCLKQSSEYLVYTDKNVTVRFSVMKILWQKVSGLSCESFELSVVSKSVDIAGRAITVNYNFICLNVTNIYVSLDAQTHS